MADIALKYEVLRCSFYGDTFLAKPNAGDFTLISDSWSYTSDA
jgi:hypothetical protein